MAMILSNISGLKFFLKGLVDWHFTTFIHLFQFALPLVFWFGCISGTCAQPGAANVCFCFGSPNVYLRLHLVSVDSLVLIRVEQIESVYDFIVLSGGEFSVGRHGSRCFHSTECSRVLF